MGILSGTRPEHLGVEDGRLRPVREGLTNAVSSFATTPYHRIEPLAAGDDPRAGFEALRRIVSARPDAAVIRSEPGYLYLEFSTRWLRFVDDVEFLLDEAARVIHVRSASRLGRRDFGVNRARIDSIRTELAAALSAGGRSGNRPDPGNSSRRQAMNTRTTASGLQIEDVTTGEGAEATRGSSVRVHYTGWLYEDGSVGRKFDSSKDRGEPFEFPLGAGHVIRGWDEGVAGMRVGGTRRLVIPPDLGYGARGAGGVIPPNATLLFEVELLGV